MTEYIVTLRPGSGIGSELLGILGGLFYLEKNEINSILYVNQMHASTPVNCFINYFLDKEKISCLHFINEKKENCQELFYTKQPNIYSVCLNNSTFKTIVSLFNKIFILKKEYNNKHYDICINIRRGDKITCESHIPYVKIEEYIKSIEKINILNPTIFHTSDEYDSFLEIKKHYPQLETFTDPEEKGYFLSELNKKPIEDLYDHVNKFMNQLNIMKHSTYFIGTNSTSVGYLVKLLRNVIQDDLNIYSGGLGGGTPAP